MRRVVAAVLVLSLVSWGPCEARSVAAASSVAQWRDEALRAGWPASAWTSGRLPCIIRRESHGSPTAVGDHGNAIGLMQIRWDVHQSWLKKAGFSRESLKNGYLNLRAARLLYKRSQKFTGDGWRPWRSRRHPC